MSSCLLGNAFIALLVAAAQLCTVVFFIWSSKRRFWSRIPFNAGSKSNPGLDSLAASIWYFTFCYQWEFFCQLRKCWKFLKIGSIFFTCTHTGTATVLYIPNGTYISFQVSFACDNLLKIILAFFNGWINAVEVFSIFDIRIKSLTWNTQLPGT